MKTKITLKRMGDNVHVMAIKVGHGVYVHRTIEEKGWTISVGLPPHSAFFRHMPNKDEAIKLAKLIAALFDFSGVAKVEDIPEEIREHLRVVIDLLNCKYD